MEKNKYFFEDLDKMKDLITEEPPVHEEVLKKYKQKQISILIDRSSMRYFYYRLTDNYFLKILHILLSIYSHPITVIASIVLSIVYHKYMYVLYYIFGIAISIIIEDKIMSKIVINSVIDNQDIYKILYKKGILKIKEKNTQNLKI